jgi:hypothetical protein
VSSANRNGGGSSTNAYVSGLNNTTCNIYGASLDLLNPNAVNNVGNSTDVNNVPAVSPRKTHKSLDRSSKRANNQVADKDYVQVRRSRLDDNTSSPRLHYSTNNELMNNENLLQTNTHNDKLKQHHLQVTHIKTALHSIPTTNSLLNTNNNNALNSNNASAASIATTASAVANVAAIANARKSYEHDLKNQQQFKSYKEDSQASLSGSESANALRNRLANLNLHQQPIIMHKQQQQTPNSVSNKGILKFYLFDVVNTRMLFGGSKNDFLIFCHPNKKSIAVLK